MLAKLSIELNQLAGTAPSGVSSVNRTCRGPVAATVTSDHDVADGP